jgi:hypothetical protein
LTFVRGQLVVRARQAAFGGNPSGKEAVTRYFNQKGDPTSKLQISKWFEIGGANFEFADQVPGDDIIVYGPAVPITGTPSQ